MELLLAAAVALLVVALAAAAIAYVWYHQTGWAPFSASAGDDVAWAPAAGKPVTRLRFKNCTFTVARGDGAAPQSRDVTGVLNAMAQAYVGATPEVVPKALSLHSPLSGFSFVLAGYNDDSTTPPTAAVAQSPWCSGADATGACIVRPAKTATLTGLVRTI